MKPLAVIATLPLLLAACDARSYSDDWEARKAQCTAPDFDVCAEIGHQARQAEGGPAKPAEPFILSQPIID